MKIKLRYFLLCLLLFFGFNSYAYVLNIIHIEKKKSGVDLWLKTKDPKKNLFFSLSSKNEKLFNENYETDAEGNIKINNVGVVVYSDKQILKEKYSKYFYDTSSYYTIFPYIHTCYLILTIVMVFSQMFSLKNIFMRIKK